MNGARRGAATVESALILTVVLAVLIGALRVGLAGYSQIAADGAAFYNARENALAQTNPTAATLLNPAAATHTAFPRSNKATITNNTYAPPSVDESTNYGFGTSNDRRGGASLIQPLQTLSTVTFSGLDSLSLFAGGGLLTVQGIGVDSTFKETGVHGGIGGNNFGTVASFNSAVDYFSQGENTPPYFGGFHYMRFCDYPSGSGSWNYCPVAPAYQALGIAEYLDQDNWTRPVTGVLPSPTAVFWETLYHQQIFACLSRQLPSSISGGNQYQAQMLLAHDGTYGSFIYTWDSEVAGGFPPVGYTPGQYPLNPGSTTSWLASC